MGRDLRDEPTRKPILPWLILLSIASFFVAVAVGKDLDGGEYLIGVFLLWITGLFIYGLVQSPRTVWLWLVAITFLFISLGHFMESCTS